MPSVASIERERVRLTNSLTISGRKQIRNIFICRRRRRSQLLHNVQIYRNEPQISQLKWKLAVI